MNESLDLWSIVYVELLDEGSTVWRPVEALKIGPVLFRLSARSSDVMQNEAWAFAPGTTVECEQRIAADASPGWYAIKAGPHAAGRF